MNILKTYCVIALIIYTFIFSCNEKRGINFDSQRDLISLHYDHAPDKDDGQSAAADRTILETMFGTEWIKRNVTAVSGAYGKNKTEFNINSNMVMDSAWNDCGGWFPAHSERDKVIYQLVGRWSEVMKNGGRVWVKEGGQSDLTAAVIREIKNRFPDLNSNEQIYVVQHSDWNEDQTTDADLEYVKKHSDYIRIRDANAYLNIKGGDNDFEKAARNHPVFGPVWQAAFQYYDPDYRLDFSDSGELMYILGLGELSITEFKQRFLLASGS